MIRICHVQLLPILSGVQRVMVEMFRHLDRRRYEPHVVCQGPGPLSEKMQEMDVSCHFVPQMVRPIRPLKDVAGYKALLQLFRQQQFHLVHTHSSKPGVLGRLAARRAGVPWVVHHVHGFAFHPLSPSLSKLAYGRIEKFVGRSTDWMLFVNHEDREIAVRGGYLPPERCLTIYNGVELDRFSPQMRMQNRADARRKLGIAADETAVIFLARLDVPKQPLILPKIVAHLQALRPNDRWRLVIAGSGEFENQLREQIRQAGLERRVSLVGWQPQPEQVLYAGDVVLQPSLWEALPLTVVEAGACGLPVVASAAKGNREVVTRQTGFLCQITDAKDYALRLAELISNPTLRTALGENARIRAVRLFDGQRNMRQVGEFYDGLFPADATQRPVHKAA